MYIVIAGGGRTGESIAAALIAGGHETFVIDHDPARVAAIRSRLGSVAAVGDVASMSCLNDAGMSRASIVVAATDSDEDNLAVCQLARTNFDVPKSIALAHRPENARLFEVCGVDIVVSSIDLIVSSVASSLPAHPLVNLMLIRDRGLEIVAVTIPAGAAATGKPLRDVAIPYGSNIVLIIGEAGPPETPTPDTVLAGETLAIALCPVDSTTKLWEALTEMR